jgi:DNA-directed RNA polymerase sigma subunit (sigma70/sigma32)
MQNDLSQFLASLVSANLAHVLQQNAPPAEQKEQQQEAQPARMTREERNRLVIELLERLTPLIRKCATAYSLDFEDMYQEASIAIMCLLDAGIDGIYDLPAYVAMRVKSRMIDKLRYVQCRRGRTISLDAPVSQDADSFSLADLLPCPYSMQPDAAVIAQEDIEEAFLWVPDFQSSNTRRSLRWLGETAAASLVGGAV